MSSENPFEPPRAPLTAVGVRSGRREDLKSVAVAQKVILVCILIYLAAVAGQFALPPKSRPILAIGMVVVGLVSTVFVFLLAMKVYSTGLGILLGILAIVPCVGLIVLLLVNAKATNVLRENGHKVGLLGADLAGF